MPCMMSAESLGRDLLGEVKEEGLGELLRSLRELATPYDAPLGFSPLDQLLNVFQNPPLTRQQQQYHHAQRSPQQRLAVSIKEKPPPVFEIASASPCSGKTQLLYFLISLSLLPAIFNGTSIYGKGAAVVLLDLSSKFSIIRLSQVMKNHVSSICSTSPNEPSDPELSSLIEDSLLHLHVFRSQSSSSFLATLSSLPTYLLAQPSPHFSTNRTLSMLAINDLSAFLWQDRLDADESSGPPTTTTKYSEKANNSLFLQRHRNLVTSLRHLQHQFSCAIVATNWGLSPITSVASSGQRALRPHLPSVWNNFCTVKVVVERDRVPKFGPGMSAEECLKEAPLRWEAVEKSGFSAWVNWWESEGWRDEVREGVRRLPRGGSFSFRVTQAGVHVGGEDD